MTTHLIKRLFTNLLHSRRGLAIPATFLILFVTMIGMVSITYYFSIEKVNAQSQTLKVSAAKQDMTSLDEAVLSVLWEPGSSRIVEFGNDGGELNVNASSNLMTLQIADGGELSSTIFNDTIGQVAYALPYSASLDTGIFLKGESRTIVNQSGSGITQLSIKSGVEHPEVQLRYRPILSHANAGVEDGRPVNCLRFYVVTLTSSEISGLMGAMSLKVSCVTTQMTTSRYYLLHANQAALVTCSLDQESGQVTVPLESTDDGAVVQVEVVLCTLEIGRVVR